LANICKPLKKIQSANENASTLLISKKTISASLLTKVPGDYTTFQQIKNYKISKYFISLENFEPANDNALDPQEGSKIIVPTHLLNKVFKIHTFFKKDPLTSQIWLNPPPIDSWQCGYKGFFFVWQIFVTWRREKKKGAGESNKGTFENLKKKFAIC
jgi:hypothetical protein